MKVAARPSSVLHESYQPVSFVGQQRERRSEMCAARSPKSACESVEILRRTGR